MTRAIRCFMSWNVTQRSTRDARDAWRTKFNVRWRKRLRQAKHGGYNSSDGIRWHGSRIGYQKGKQSHLTLRLLFHESKYSTRTRTRTSVEEGKSFTCVISQVYDRRLRTESTMTGSTVTEKVMKRMLLYLPKLLRQMIRRRREKCCAAAWAWEREKSKVKKNNAERKKTKET